MTPTLVVIDDHGGFRAFARALLQAEGYDVVGEAADGVSGAELPRRAGDGATLETVEHPDSEVGRSLTPQHVRPRRQTLSGPHHQDHRWIEA